METVTERPLRLTSPSFVGLLITQLLTAVNDNAFRWLVIGVGKQMLERSGSASSISYILTAGTACFVLPYLVLAAPAGYLADRFSKQRVIVACKVAEIGIMALGIGALLLGNLWLLMAVVALMGMQSALFSPAKLGSIPELLPAEKISAANGMMGLTTVIASVGGMAAGNLLADQVGENFGRGVTISAVFLLSVAIVGWLASLLIHRLQEAAPDRKFPWNAIPQTIDDFRKLASSLPLLRVAFGIMFFWAVGSLAQLNIDQFAFESGATKQAQIVPLLLSLVAGVGIGSVLAGVWSGDHIELGILPLGAAGVAVNAMLLFLVPGELIDPGSSWTVAYVVSMFLLFALGVSAGLFNVPLDSYMQHHSPPDSRGAVLAASNFLTFAGILLTACIFAGLRAPVRMGEPLLTSRQIFLACGLLTIGVFVYIVWRIPQASIRFMVWLASKTVYRISIHGRKNLPARGGALLVANHVSWLDGALILLASSRPVRVLAYAGNFRRPWVKWLADLFGVILITSGPKSIVAGLRTAREALKQGELVCIFAEGAITRTGQMQPFKPGLMKIMQGADVPAIPVYLDELWGSIFSFQGGKFFWKRPTKWPYPISIHFGQPISNFKDVHQMESAVRELGAQAVEQRMERKISLAQGLVRTCKKRRRRDKIADSTGNALSGCALLMRALILRRLLRRQCLEADERFVGILLPPSVGAVVVNAAITLDRRVPVNLNYTVSSDVMNECVRQAGIKHVLTSRKFMEKMPFELDAELVFLEDFRNQPRLSDKLVSLLSAYLLPASMIERQLDLRNAMENELATVIFTSGSTGQPKGVMLSERNITSNVDAIEQVVHLSSDDVLVGILPFFHSFGFTVCLWTTLLMDIKGVFHFSPLDGRQVGKLTKTHGGTLLLATPTFLRTYLRRCEPDEFTTLDAILTGAEKLPTELADALEKKFGVRPVEGYGATETAPLVSVNIPPSRSLGSDQIDCKEGTVGRPVPGVTVKTTDLETGGPLGVGQPGMLWVKGPNIMQGYLGRADLTAEVLRDGWYMTGDVAVIDADGFIQITGRESRFSKIGGEMVPHIKIEETLAKIIAASEEDGIQAVVTAVPHAKKGERLIVIHKPLDKKPGELCRGLAAEGLPNLFIPSEDSFLQVDDLPLLGTGKMDLKGIKQLALDAFGEPD